MSGTQYEDKKTECLNYVDDTNFNEINKVQKQSLATLTAMASPNAISNCQELPHSQKGSRSHKAPRKLVSVMFHRGGASSDNAVPKENLIDGHIFVNQTFKRATFCDVCQRLLLDYQRQGLRCRTCKVNIHKTCTNNIGHCDGRPMFGSGFTRQAGDTNSESSKEEDVIDSVYQILQEGKVLRSGEVPSDMTDQHTAANHNKVGSPNKQSSTDAVSSSKLTSPAVYPSERSPIMKRRSFENLPNTYVALYKFNTADKDDLTLTPGDKIHVTKDKDDIWWMGRHNGSTGFFPATFVAKIRSAETVYAVNKSMNVEDIYGNVVSLKKDQIIFINPEWPIMKKNHVYWRVGLREGYIASADITPL